MKSKPLNLMFHYNVTALLGLVVFISLLTAYYLNFTPLLYMGFAGLVAYIGWVFHQLRQNQQVCKHINTALQDGSPVHSFATGNLVLNDLLTSLASYQSKASSLNAMVGTVSVNLAANAEEIAITAKVISEQMVMQSQRVQDIHQRIEKMQQAFSASIVTAEQTVDVASKSEAEGNSGKLVMTEAMSSISALVESVQSSGTRVRELGTVSESISGIINVIKGVAEQTNLLALNAAIEAARAGEQGRGFAVVADEVRSLASKTQQYADEIHNIISDLIQQVNKTETEIKATVELAQQSDEHIEGVVMSYSEIVGYMLEVNKLGESLATTTKNEKVSSSDIYAMIDEIKVIGETTRDNISNLAGASAELGKLGEQLDMLASKKSAGSADDDIDLF